MELKPVNSINNDSNTIRVSDGNSPIRLIFKDAKGEVINLYDKIDYFYLTKDDVKFYSVTDISYDGDEVIIRLPKIKKGQYKAEIRDKDGSIYPANEDLYILLRRSFEDDKDIYYFGHREDILNNVEPIIIQHIDKNPNKFRGERGQQGFPGRDGLPGIDGKDGKDGIDGEKGDPGKDGSMSFIDLTPEEKEELRGERGRPGLDGKDGIDGIDGKDGLPGRDGIDGKDGQILNQKIGINNLIELDKLEIFNQGTIENIDFENGSIEIKDTNWLVVQKNIYLENKKYAVRVANVENINRSSFGFYVIKDASTVKSINVQPGDNGILDLTAIVPGYYDLRLYYGNKTVIPGVTKIVKPMLVEGDISVLWNHKEREDVLTTSISKYIPSDYANLTVAFNELSKYRPNNNTTFEIIFESGHRPSRGVSLSNGDFSHFIISSVDPIVSVSDSFTGHFLRVNNCSAPVFNTVIDMRDRGDAGLRIEGASKGHALPGSGVLNAGGTGLYVRTSSFQAPYSKFSGCLGRNVWITRGANVSIANSDLTNPRGDAVGVYVSRSSILDASDCDISGGIASQANIQVLRSIVTLLGAKVNDAFRDGVHAGAESKIVLRGGEVKNAGRNAIRSSGGASVNLGVGTDLSDAGEDAIYASLTGIVSGKNTIVSKAGRHGVYCHGGAKVSIPGINASNCIASGLYATNGGEIILADPDDLTLKSYLSFNGNHGIYASSGSKIVVANAVIGSNTGSGIYGINGSSVSLISTQIMDSVNYGIYASACDVTIRGTSSIKRSGSTIQDLHVVAGAIIRANGTATTDSPSVSPMTGNSNIETFNTITRDGIIFA